MKNSLQILVLLVMSGFILQSSIVDTPVSDLKQPEKYFLLGKYKQSIRLYRNQLTKSANKEIENYNIGYLYFLQGKMDSAKYFSEQSLKYNASYGPAYFLKGLIEYTLQNYSLAKNYLEISIANHPDREFPLYYLGKIHFQERDYKQAYKYLDEATNSSDIFSLAYPLIGRSLARLGKDKKAINVLEKGLSVSYDAEILLALIDLYKETDQNQEAQKYAGLLKFLFPDHNAADHLSKEYPEANYKNGFREIPQRNKSSNVFFPVGEKALYNVTFGPIKVGELYTEIQDSLTFNDKEVYQVRFSLDSNPDLAFAAVLHSDYLSYIDKYTKQVELHYLHTHENDKIWDKLYSFDRARHKFLCRTVRKDGHIDILEKYLPRNTIDGTSILFYARQIVKEQRSERVMTIIDENFVISDINYSDKMEIVEVRGKEENCFLVTGINHYKGIVGFTGGFRGWFRNNSSLLPVKSDFKIWVGRIKVTMASEEEQRIHKYSR